MSLYNQLFGMNELAPILLEMLNMGPNGKYPTGRFRDIELSSDGTQIMLCTRDGGGNREFGPFEEWRSHPNYLNDEDDDFDCTYSYIDFSVPEEYQELCQTLCNPESEPETVSKKFAGLIAQLKGD